MSADQQLYQMFIVEMEKAKNLWADLSSKLSANPSVEDKKDIYKKVFMSAHNLKAASQMCRLPELGKFFHKFEDLISGFSRGRLNSDEGIPELLAIAQVLIERWFLHVKLKTVAAPDCTEFFKSIESLIVARSVPNSSDPTNSASQASLPRPEVNPTKNDELELGESDSNSKASKSKTKNKRTDINDKILVSSMGLDEMISLIGGMSVNFEIMLHQLRNDYNLKQREVAALHTLGQTILWLKETCLQIRMQPARSLLENLENAAQDVSEKLKKPLNVIRQGDDILLDKSVLEGLFDILLHIVRNAVDHGIESFQERQETDKDLIATLNFSVADIGGNAVIQISDDGAGINPENVFKKAVEKGLVMADAQLSPEQIIELIFTPEFSTAKEITALSGRGVGMDIVRSAIQAMGGSIQVKSAVGNGTTFKITVPTQMSLIEAFVITINNQRYAVPKQDLIEILDLTEGETQVRGYEKTTAIRTGLRMTPAVSLRRWFGHATPADGEILPGGRPPDAMALVIRQDDLPYAFLVDEVRGLQQVFVRPVPENMSNLRAVSGAAVFSDGEPGLILNLPILLNSAQGAA